MIKTLPAAVIAALFLASCAGYFDAENADRTGKTVQPLAIAGGGYLSSDTHNEITPFVFRDPNTGRNWLFYSSDKDGTYDIYYSELLSDGMFNQPFKLDYPINTSNSNELSPILFFYNRSGSVELYISFIQKPETHDSTNIISWVINSNTFNTNDWLQDTFPTNAIHIGYEMETNDLIYGGRLIVSFGSGNVVFYKKGIDHTEFRWGIVSMGEPRTNYQVMNSVNTSYAANGFYEPVSENYYYIFQNSSSQLWGGAVTSFGDVTNFFSIPAYASSYHDRDPFIDYGDVSWPVYFSSDRYGRGNFDLYRYNSMTFKKVIP